MRNSFGLIALFVFFSNTLLGQRNIAQDTLIHFENNVEMQMFARDDGGTEIVVSVSDSIQLFKQYSKEGILLKSVEADLEGRNHGACYYHYPERELTVKGRRVRGVTQYLFSINNAGDTIGFEKNQGDTVLFNMTKNNGVIRYWYTNMNYISTGEIMEYYVKDNSLKLQGEYIVVTKSDIADLDCYQKERKKNGFIENSISFRGKAEQTELPIGKWVYYDELGLVVDVRTYSWGDCFKKKY